MGLTNDLFHDLEEVNNHARVGSSGARRLEPQKSAKLFVLLGFLSRRLDDQSCLGGVGSEALVDQFPQFATKCYQTATMGSHKLLKMVDLVGIEPTTSSMPWNRQGGRPLILKQLMAGQTGKTGTNSAICYQIATKLNEWDRRADSWGISPSRRANTLSSHAGVAEPDRPDR